MTKIQLMPFKRYTLEQKKAILREYYEDHISIAQLARKYKINAVTVYNWKRMAETKDKKMEKPLAPQEVLEELERLRKENKKLKSAVADLTLDKACQKDIIEAFKKKLLVDKVGKFQKKS